MGLRPAKCYRWDTPAYTRKAKNPGDSFITGIPGSKLNRFETGNLSAEFDTEVSIVSLEDMQIRSNALEAARIVANKILEKALGATGYRMKVRVFPHHVLRENVMATGAGADRVQMGMRKSFGKPMGTAARVKEGQKVLTVYINKSEPAVIAAKKAMKMAIMKFPCDSRIVIEPVKKKSKAKKPADEKSAEENNS